MADVVVPGSADPVPGAESGSTPTAEPVAVIGLACRLPGADGPDALWRLLRAGGDAVTRGSRGALAERGPARLPLRRLPRRRRPLRRRLLRHLPARGRGHGPAAAAGAGTGLGGAGARPARARRAGRRPGRRVPRRDRAPTTPSLAGRTTRAARSAHTYTGAHRAIIANRVSYALRLRGPSLTLDAGQSSSLVAVHLACESLRHGESTVALAGGVNLNLLAETTRRDRRVRRAVAGRPLSRLRRRAPTATSAARAARWSCSSRWPPRSPHGDPVLAVILGGAVNNDGGGDGLTVAARRGPARSRRSRRAARPGCAPATCSTWNCTAPARAVGDPVEAAALGAALGGAHRTADASAAGRLGEDEHRPPGRRRGHRRAAQGGAQPARTASCRRACTSRRRTRPSRWTSCGLDVVHGDDAVAGAGPSRARRRGQLVRHGRYQLPPGGRPRLRRRAVRDADAGMPRCRWVLSAGPPAGAARTGCALWLRLSPLMPSRHDAVPTVRPGARLAADPQPCSSTARSSRRRYRARG